MYSPDRSHLEMLHSEVAYNCVQYTVHWHRPSCVHKQSCLAELVVGSTDHLVAGSECRKSVIPVVCMKLGNGM